jgi:L-iditol 2-dehydrogenase
MYLKALGVKKLYAITAGNNDRREELARRLGADEVLNLSRMGADEVTAYLQKENGGLGVDLCFEASGAPVAVAQGMNILRNRGVYLVPGQYSNSGGIEIQPQMITFKALQMIGSSQYAMTDVRNYLAFLEAHPEVHEKISPLATQYPIRETNRAFEDARAGKNIKTVLIP